MQFAGQTSLHCGSSSAPTHSVHFSGSMTYIGLPAVIALFGQTGSQASHAVHASLIIRAIALSPHILIFSYSHAAFGTRPVVASFSNRKAPHNAAPIAPA